MFWLHIDKTNFKHLQHLCFYIIENQLFYLSAFPIKNIIYEKQRFVNL
jgi:hypothetical protein